MALTLIINVERNRDAILDVEVQFKAEDSDILVAESGADILEG